VVAPAKILGGAISLGRRGFGSPNHVAVRATSPPRKGLSLGRKGLGSPN